MESKIDLILTKLESLEKRLDDIEKNWNKMNAHVDFIHSVHESLKGPLDYITYYFSKPKHLKETKTLCK